MLSTKRNGRSLPQVQSLKAQNWLSALLKTKKHTVLSCSSDNWNLSYHSSGFSLIELLVAIVIAGILSTIALPTFLRQVNKAKEVEVITRVRSILDLQIEHYITHNQFANSLEDLQFSLSSETENYQYIVLSENQNLNGSVLVGLSKKSYLKSYAGVVFSKDGQTPICTPIPLNINQTTPSILIIPQINDVIANPNDVIANPEEYCTDATIFS